MADAGYQRNRAVTSAAFTPRPEFADIFIGAAERQAAGSDPAAVAELARLHEIHDQRDPVCWLWPAPANCSFPDDGTAAQFLHWWNRDCAICGAPGLDLVEDHDHATGLVRGWLCRSCNIQEGKSDVPVYRKYRERPPAVILGIRVRYANIFGETPMTPTGA